METTVQNQNQQSILKPQSLAKECDYRTIGALVTEIYLMKSRTLTSDILRFITAKMHEEFTQHYFYLTVEEVKKAWYNGVRGYYGEVFEISVVALCSWLDAYITSDEHNIYVQNHAPKLKQISQFATKTEIEIQESIRAFLLSAFEKFKKHGQIEFFPDKIYDFLSSANLITPSQDEKNKAYANSVIQIALNKKNMHGLKLRDYISTLTRPENYKKERIYYAKKIIAENFFNRIIESNNTEDFINKLKAKKT